MIDFKRLERVCNMPIKNFRGMGRYDKTGRYVFIPSNNLKPATMLAVAHLDTVRQETNFRWDNNNVYSPRLDNRLGTYIILELLPKYLKKLGYTDVSYDILLTEDEEMGNSTAQYFKTDKPYNFMFSFDRTGRDVVMYQFENDRDVTRLEGAGFAVGIGSYSDIAELDTLKCAGYNIGCGMTDYHSVRASAPIRTIQSNVIKWADFLGEFHDTPMPVDAKPRYSAYTYYGRWSEDDYAYTTTYKSKYITNPTTVTLSSPAYNASTYDICPNCNKAWVGDVDNHTYDITRDVFTCGKVVYPFSSYAGTKCPNCGGYHHVPDGKHTYNENLTRYSCNVEKYVPMPAPDVCYYCSTQLTDDDIDSMDLYDMCKACSDYLSDGGEVAKLTSWTQYKRKNL